MNASGKRTESAFEQPAGHIGQSSRALKYSSKIRVTETLTIVLGVTKGHKIRGGDLRFLRKNADGFHLRQQPNTTVLESDEVPSYKNQWVTILRVYDTEFEKDIPCGQLGQVVCSLADDRK